MRRSAPLFAAALAASACAGREPAAPAPRPEAALPPHRIVHTASGRSVDLDALADTAAAADVVFFGEEHDDAAAHRLQHALLEALARRRDHVTLSLEMFERDVQPALDDYLAGRITEERFLAGARPWPNYAAAYRPLVRFARERGWRVVAANAPRPYATLVARAGLDTLRALPPAARRLVAREISCPEDAYFRRFAESMDEHPGGDGEDAVLLRYYQAQCVKDETMAESIAGALAASPGAPVVHVTGSFHSDFGHGIPARVARRLPGARLLVLTAIPVADPARATAAGHGGRADYLLFTRRP